MCCEHDCMPHGWHYWLDIGYHMPLISIEEEVKELEEYKEALEKQLEKVNKRLEALRR